MANQVSMRLAPVKTSEKLAGLAAHIDRSQVKPQEHIDAERTQFNRVLWGSGDVVGDVTAMKAKYKLAHKDTTTCAEIVLTAKAEWFNEISPQWREGIFTPQMQNWIDCNLAFLKSTSIGFANAVLHLDEEAPHIHAMVVPVATYGIRFRRGGKDVTRIAYSELFGDTQQLINLSHVLENSEMTKLGRLQTTYANAMASTGLERGIRNSNVKHVTPGEHRKRINKKLLPLPKVTTKIPDPSTLDTAKEAMGIETTHSKAVKAREKEQKAKLKAGLEQINDLHSKSIELEIVQKQVKTQKDTLIEKDKIIDDLKNQLNAAKVDDVRSIDLISVLKKAGATQSHIDLSSWLTPNGSITLNNGTYRLADGKLKKNAIDLTIDLFNCKYSDALLWLKSKFTVATVVDAAKSRAEDRAITTLAGDLTLDLEMVKRIELEPELQKSQAIKNSRFVKSERSNELDI